MFTIIIPCYNEEQYIHLMLNSLTQQIDTNFECLIIDDGSTDNSASIIQSYTQQYSNWHYCYKKHEGLIAALKYGAHLANSNYICFLDADDMTLPIMTQECNRALEMYHPEAIEYDFYSRKLLKFNSPFLHKQQSPTVLSATDNSLQGFKNKFLEGRHCAIRWNKLMTKSLFAQIEPYYDNRLAYSEDVFFATAFYTFVSNLVLIHQPLMEYLDHPGTMSRTFNQEALTSCELIYNLLKSPPFNHVKYANAIYKRMQMVMGQIRAYNLAHPYDTIPYSVNLTEAEI